MKLQVSKPRAAVIALLSLLVLGLIGAGILWGIPWSEARQKEKALQQKISESYEAREALSIIRQGEADKEKDSKNAKHYLQIGNHWLLIADLLQDEYAREKALRAYEVGIRATESKNSVLILNAGNVYRQMGRYEEAEAKYKQGIDLNPGDAQAYERLIELYRFDMKKEPKVIGPLFERALDTLVENARIVQLFAEYLVSIGREKDALQYYELLAGRYPGQFDAIVADLRLKVQAENP